MQMMLKWLVFTDLQMGPAEPSIMIYSLNTTYWRKCGGVLRAWISKKLPPEHKNPRARLHQRSLWILLGICESADEFLLSD